jgi:hypothetical protein
MRKTLWTVASVMVAALVSAEPASAAIIEFSTPAAFSGAQTLVQFDELGLPAASEFRAVSDVGFALLERESLIDTGFGPTLAYAPDTTYAREFPPRDGPAFLNTINFAAAGADLQIDFALLVSRVAAEIRSGRSGNDVGGLTFELYRAGVLVGARTSAIRGQDDFFFYGLASTVPFDRWVIRQRPDDRIGLDNLRYETPEPGSVLLSVGVAGIIALRRKYPAAR